MAKSFSIAGAGLNRAGLLPLNLGQHPAAKSTRHRTRNHSAKSPKRRANSKSCYDEWNVQPLDFYSLEKNTEVLVINHMEHGSFCYVRDCSKCDSREKVPGCKRCGGNRFGVFHIHGNMHGIFCQKCSLGVDRWICPSCHHSNICDQTIKLLTKNRRPSQSSTNDYVGGKPASNIWNYLIVFLLFIFLIFQALP